MPVFYERGEINPLLENGFPLLIFILRRRKATDETFVTIRGFCEAGNPE